ncbi:uncharacterized protein sS8_2006 [Methylocaldum marinum]|uniref:HdeD protein n=1 Tax=Methylocaldum marinum TaxID=1432792 RepID=A0A250KQM1_9GAMM|nr:HdeD family acid-resistance protein [Methylocaldum marinum]BBA33960.1 uncharacterized protein sS8_2006 [Methylocaldum marinum]
MAYHIFDPTRDWRADAMHELRRHSAWYLGLGIALIILGLITAGYALVATFVSVLYIGVLLLVGGIVQLGHAFGTRTWSGFFLHLLGAILYLAAGWVMVTNVEASAVSLTLLLAVFLIAGGVFRIVGALLMRFPSWNWALLNGAVTLLLGILIAEQWPTSGLWVIGAFVGIDMLFTGLSFIMLSLAARGIGGDEFTRRAT